MSRRDEHTHPCAACEKPVECDGELRRNYDGWPETICDAYHRPSGHIAAVLCDDCLLSDEADPFDESEETK